MALRGINPWVSTLPSPALVPQYRGDWEALGYEIADVVRRNNTLWISHDVTAPGEAPGVSPKWKDVFDAQGLAGSVGTAVANANNAASIATAAAASVSSGLSQITAAVTNANNAVGAANTAVTNANNSAASNTQAVNTAIAANNAATQNAINSISTSLGAYSTVYPRFTGGQLQTLVVLSTDGQGNNVWKHADRSMKEELDGIVGFIGTDNKVYPMGTVAPVVASSTNQEVMLSNMGQPLPNQNVKYVPVPWLASEDPTPTQNTYIFGRTSADGKWLFTYPRAVPLWLPSTVPDVFEYNFVQGTDTTKVYDLSGKGNNATIAGTGAAWTARGLQVTNATTVTTASLPVTNNTMTIVVVARRANSTGNHQIYGQSNGPSNGWRWGGGGDQPVWYDMGQPPGFFYTAVPANQTVTYTLVFNGTLAQLYQGKNKVGEITLGAAPTPGNQTVRIGGWYGGNPFEGEWLYYRVINEALDQAGVNDAVDQANTRVGSRLSL